MKLDIAFVTYNSNKWINKNIESILKSKYNLKNISLYYYDNSSTDDTVIKLNDLKKKYENKFSNFEIKVGKKNKGFGYGSNKAALLGSSDYILFLNIDTEIYEDTFTKIENEIINSSNSIGIYELRQEPYEHPKYYDPITGYTSWASGACMIIKRSIFNKTKGFDRNLFMYCEDVELSWHVRKLGYNIKYLYNVPIIHYSYTSPNVFKENQFIYAYINNLYLRCKYGNLKKCLSGHKLCFNAFRRNMLCNIMNNDKYKKIRNRMFKEYLKMSFKRLCIFIKSRFYSNKYNFIPKFYNDLDYEAAKHEPFYVLEPLKEQPLVSVIVRTCGRPSILRETLISLRNQIYKNFEIIVVEDGKNISEKMISDEFNDLNINYKASGEKVGRSKIGNIGMTMAKGKYLNFLDDDDLFYPDHIYVLLSEALKNNASIVYATAFETPIIVNSKDPYEYVVVDKYVNHYGPFSKIDLYKNNITPIQAVMFKKEVFEECGGLDESIDALEDWDLWIKFSLKYNFYHTEKTTSIYRVPANSNLTEERQIFLNSSIEYLMKKHKNDVISLSPSDIYNKKEEEK